MESAVISSKFQVVIPKSVREKMGIKKGQEVVFQSLKNEIRLVVVPPLSELEGKFPELSKTPSRKALWEDEMR